MTDEAPPTLIDKYMVILDKWIDSPKMFKRATTYSLIASTLGRQYKFYSPKKQKMFIRPNEWFLLSCIPARGRRSDLEDDWEECYDSILRQFFKYKGLDNLQDRIDTSKFAGGTKEGIVDKIQIAYETYHTKEFTIFDDEFGVTLSSMKEGAKGKDLLGLFTKIYYGSYWSEDLSQRDPKKKSGRYVPRDSYINMLCGMQELKYYLKGAMATQGFLRRAIICYIKDFPDPDAPDSGWMPPLLTGKEKVEKLGNSFCDDASLLSKEIFEKMEANDRTMKEHEASYQVFKRNNEENVEPFININIRDEILEEINQVAKECDRNASDSRERENIDLVLLTKWEHLLKLTMLEAIARSDLKINPNLSIPEITVERKDFERAKNFLDMTKNTDDDISNALSYEGTPEERATPLAEIKEFVRSGGESGKTETEIYNKFGKRYKSRVILEDHLGTLVKAKEIVIGIEQRGKRGPKSVVYWTPEYHTEETSK